MNIAVGEFGSDGFAISNLEAEGQIRRRTLRSFCGNGVLSENLALWWIPS